MTAKLVSLLSLYALCISCFTACTPKSLSVKGQQEHVVGNIKARLTEQGLPVDQAYPRADRVQTRIVCFKLDRFRGVQWQTAFGLESRGLRIFQFDGDEAEQKQAQTDCQYQFRVFVQTQSDQTGTEIKVGSDWWKLALQSCETVSQATAQLRCKYDYRSTAPPYHPERFVYGILGNL